jgi:hypothetical protein
MNLSSWVHALACFAQEDEDSLSKVSQSFREYSEGQGWLAVVMGLAIVGVIVTAVLSSLLSARRRSAPWRAFREFAEANGLTTPETKLLILVAERVQPETPAALFVKRSLFESAVVDLKIDPDAASTLRQKVYGP